MAKGLRGRRVHDVTTPGCEALRAWLLGPHDDGRTVRNEFVLRLFLLSALENDDAQRVLQEVRSYADQQIAVLEGAQRDMAEAGEPTSAGPNLAAQFGVLSYRAARDWAGWAGEQLERRSERMTASR